MRKPRNTFETIFVPLACVLGFIAIVILIYHFQFLKQINMEIALSLLLLFGCSGLLLRGRFLKMRTGKFT